jgi:hypothetical protein
VHGKQNPDFFEKLTNSRDPKSQGLAWTKMSADDFACLIRGKSRAARGRRWRTILFNDRASGITVLAAEKWHAIGTLGEKNFETFRFRRPQQDYGRRLACLYLSVHWTSSVSAAPKELRQGAPAQ